ncbi:MAG: sigma-54 dependent transcriptional regulator [Candidatus Aminicenantes bacterium]|nr:sigma-54 dependent transcriptional regulator [Candidatus Aminicenantes bacterium]
MDENRNVPLPILLVDDETQVLLLYSGMLKGAGIETVVTLDDSRRVLPFMRENRVLAVLADLNMPFIGGRDLLAQIKQEFPEVPVLIVTGVDDIETAVECMHLGAADYLVKPVERSRLVSSLQRTLEVARLQGQVFSLTRHLLTDGLNNPGAFAHLVTGSRKMLALFKYVEVVADSPYPALIVGETGVGKELVARSIHLAGDPSRPFVAINVAGLDDNMFSDTLFGHKKGAFTGADVHRDGLISQAQDGTLFLDEIGDLSSTSQVKLLRLIQEKEYYPLGIDQPKKSNARIVCSTNHELKALVENGSFRNDLYFRLNTHVIAIPPLRERREDIPLLLGYFLQESARALRKRTPTPPPELLNLLATYDFPGNVREMQTMVADAVSRHRAGVLSMDSFRGVVGAQVNKPRAEDLAADGQASGAFLDGLPTLKQAENFLIRRALEQSKGNQGIASTLLGITRQALNKRLVREKKKRT